MVFLQSENGRTPPFSVTWQSTQPLGLSPCKRKRDLPRILGEWQRGLQKQSLFLVSIPADRERDCPAVHRPSRRPGRVRGGWRGRHDGPRASQRGRVQVLPGRGGSVLRAEEKGQRKEEESEEGERGGELGRPCHHMCVSSTLLLLHRCLTSEDRFPADALPEVSSLKVAASASLQEQVVIRSLLLAFSVLWGSGFSSRRVEAITTNVEKHRLLGSNADRRQI